MPIIARNDKNIFNERRNNPHKLERNKFNLKMFVKWFILITSTRPI